MIYIIFNENLYYFYKKELIIYNSSSEMEFVNKVKNNVDVSKNYNLKIILFSYKDFRISNKLQI